MKIKGLIWLFLFQGILGSRDQQSSVTVELSAHRADDALAEFEKRFGPVPELDA